MFPIQVRTRIDEVVAGTHRLVPDGDGWRIGDYYRRNPEPPPTEPPLTAAQVRKAIRAARKRLEAVEALVPAAKGRKT